MISLYINFSKLIILIFFFIFILTTYKFLILLCIDFDCIEFFFFLIVFLFLTLVFLSSNNLVVFYITGVAFSLITYSLIILPFNNLSIEATIKYFFVGALAFSFFLFGSSLIFGIVGSFDLIIIAYNFDYKNIFFNQNDLIFKLSLLFFLFFFLLKLGLFPAHFFLLDIYEGLLTFSVMLLFLVVKFVFFFLIIRVMVILFFENYNFWFIIISLVVIGCLLIGTFGAIFEKKIVKFLTYTSVSHMGFIFSL